MPAKNAKRNIASFGPISDTSLNALLKIFERQETEAERNRIRKNCETVIFALRVASLPRSNRTASDRKKAARSLVAHLTKAIALIGEHSAAIVQANANALGWAQIGPRHPDKTREDYADAGWAASCGVTPQVKADLESNLAALRYALGQAECFSEAAERMVGKGTAFDAFIRSRGPLFGDVFSDLTNERAKETAGGKWDQLVRWAYSEAGIACGDDVSREILRSMG